MRDKIKKTISIAVMLLCCMALGAGCGSRNQETAEQTKEKELSSGTENGFVYHESEEGTIIIDNYIGEEQIMEVPKEIQGKEVTGIGKMEENSQVTEVRLPYTVNHIEDFAFQGWSSLEQVSMLSNRQEIGAYAFAGCEALKDIYIYNSKTIGKGAFSGCRQLKRVCLANLSARSELHTLETETFAGCVALETIVMPENLVEIKADCFNGCESISELRVAGKVTRIDSFPENAIMNAAEGTYAYEYAQDNNIRVREDYYVTLEYTYPMEDYYAEVNNGIDD